MVYEECKNCLNYMVSEIGCYGSDKPCKYLGEDDDKDYYETLESIKRGMY